VEIEGTPEKCAKCGLNLSAFSDFFDLFETAVDHLEKKRAAAQPPEKKKQSTMDFITGRKAK
jgi:hypothetical protein